MSVPCIHSVCIYFINLLVRPMYSTRWYVLPYPRRRLIILPHCREPIGVVHPERTLVSWTQQWAFTSSWNLSVFLPSTIDIINLLCVHSSLLSLIPCPCSYSYPIPLLFCLSSVDSDFFFNYNFSYPISTCVIHHRVHIKLLLGKNRSINLVLYSRFIFF